MSRPGAECAVVPRAGAGALRARLSDGRWHFQHGPIDLVIAADGRADAIADAIDCAWRRFGEVLPELVAELALLRRPVTAECPLAGPIARRMHRVCAALLPRFLTPMAAVAGSVAQEIVGFFDRSGIDRAYVNNGGDIALHLTPAHSYTIGIADVAAPERGCDGTVRIAHGARWRGVATSGWRGRSFSLGIADRVTVIATDAAAADAAATVIANAVDVDDAAIRRAPADSLKDDTDLGSLPVTVAVPPLAPALVERALAAGAAEAEALAGSGLIAAAAVSVQGRWRLVGVESLHNHLIEEAA
ncbi:MAG TPA: UPF0280 family protein [Burkholderiaceae bacterium]|nr:UPF0280 family protein [Burkholderiaceae bacterium]